MANQYHQRKRLSIYLRVMVVFIPAWLWERKIRIIPSKGCRQTGCGPLAIHGDIWYQAAL